MDIHCIALGAFQTNSYVVRANEKAEECVIIDTGLDADELLSHLKAGPLQPQALLLTHAHADHIGGIPLICQAYPGVSLFVYCNEAHMLADPSQNLSSMTGQPLKIELEPKTLQDKETVKQAGIELTVVHTPGHTPGGMCLYCADECVLFAGDTLFAESVGRTDFPGGSMPLLVESIKRRLFTLPDETRVYPGHGPDTTIGHEKQFNPFVR